MLILSFRDMSVPRCGGITPGVFYDLANVGPGLQWWNPPPPLSLIPDAYPIVGGKHVCFLIHGFNVDRDSGYTGYGVFGQEMEGEGMRCNRAHPVNLLVTGVDELVPVLWPGDWYFPTNYPFLLPDIRLIGRYFAQLLLSATTRISRVSFVTHSMGVRVALETMQQTLQLAPIASFRAPRFETVVFTAPAVTDEVLDDPDYSAAVGALRRIVVVSSRGDRVLQYAFPAGNEVEQALWPRDPGADDALGRYGPRLRPGSQALGKTEWYEMPLQSDQVPHDYNHGDYVPSPWQPDPDVSYGNGWTAKHVVIGQLAQAVLNGGIPPAPPAKQVTPRT
jgi:hypothetical protein